MCTHKSNTLLPKVFIFFGFRMRRPCPKKLFKQTGAAGGPSLNLATREGFETSPRGACGIFVVLRAGGGLSGPNSQQLEP